MNDIPDKLHGGSESQLTKLKRLWLKPEFEPSREHWRERFASELTQLEIRNLINFELQIDLQWDRQLTQFRQWVDRQDALDAERAAMADDAGRILEEFGDQWTLDQIREEILKRSYARALATGDFEAGRRTIAQEMNVKKTALDREKMEEWKKSDQAKALQFCLVESREFPEVQEKFMAALAALRQAKNAKRLERDKWREEREKREQESNNR